MTQAEKFMAAIAALPSTEVEDGFDGTVDEMIKAESALVEAYDEAVRKLIENELWGSADRYSPINDDDDSNDGGLYVFADGSGVEGPYYMGDTDYQPLSTEEVIARKAEIDADYAAELAEPLLAQSAGLGKA
jgi:hypothetical protein